MNREHLIAEAVDGAPPAWADLLGRALGVTETWLPWLVLYDDGTTIGYQWLMTKREAMHFVMFSGYCFRFCLSVNMEQTLQDALDATMATATERLDWSELLP